MPPRLSFNLALLVSLAVVNKGIGFAREVVVAAQFGADHRMDGLLAGQTVPAVLARVVEDVVVASLLPLCAGWDAAQGIEAARAKLTSILRALTWSSGAAVLALMLLSPLVIDVLVPGLGAEARHIAVRSLQISLPSVGFLLIGAALTAFFNYQHRFWLPGLAGTLGNALGLLTIVVLAASSGVYSIAVATTAAAGFLVLAQVPYLLGAARAERPGTAGWDLLREFTRLAGPLAVGVLFFNGVPLVERFLASGLPEGSIAVLNYAFKVDWLTYSILVTSLTSVLFPLLASAAASGDKDGFRHTLEKGLRVGVLMVTPCAAVLAVLAHPIVQLIYERGSFLAAQTSATANLLRMYVLGLPGATASVILLHGVYALKLPRLRVKASLLLVPTTLFLGSLLSPLLGAEGIALAHAGGQSLMAVYLLWALRRRSGLSPASLVSFGSRTLLATSAAAAAGRALHAGLSEWMTSDRFLVGVGRVGVSTLSAAVVFVVACRLLRIEERQFVWRLLSWNRQHVVP